MAKARSLVGLDMHAAKIVAAVPQGAGTGSPESGSASVGNAFWQALLAACTCGADARSLAVNRP